MKSGTPGLPVSHTSVRVDESLNEIVEIKASGEGWRVKRKRGATGKGSYAEAARGKTIGLMESDMPSVNSVTGPSMMPFEVVLDSGAAEHVADSGDAPCYKVEDSPGSKAGACFIAANGEKIPNQGQMSLSLASTEGVGLKSTFQVCKTHRPLWSVGRICDSVCSATFDSAGAKVTHKATGKQLCSFQRVQGLYVSTLKLKNPGFPGQGSAP